MDGEAERGSISRERREERKFSTQRRLKRVRVGEDKVNEGEQGNGLKDGGEDAESWDGGKTQGLTAMGR